jgi:tetratricopeptide (TPR) repeat protein
MYRECVEASQLAIKIDPTSKIAYNNICSAYNVLGEYALAAEACQKALDIDPDFERAKNNLKVAQDNL